MNENTNKVRLAVGALHNYLVQTHWDGSALAGPDSGVRWNFRLGRFVKSQLPFLPWRDRYVFMQTQAYWILANWLLADLSGDERARQFALACTETVRRAQQPEGFWIYPPLPSRVGKVATVEGNLASIGLLATYRRTREGALLEAARRWHHYLVDAIGFREENGVLAINYWARENDSRVPNNTTLTLWTLAELATGCGEPAFLASSAGLISFLEQVQMESGELPYEAADQNAPGRPHFLCFQYNAFEFLDLCHYLERTADETVFPIMRKLAQFLAGGITATGAARYNCHQARPETVYYTAAVAAALAQATTLGLGDFRAEVERAYAYVLAQQRPDGGMAFFSRGNYGFLADRRSYPRNLAMILYHLLLELQVQAAPA